MCAVPQFVGQPFEHDDFVYFFFREFATEHVNAGRVVYSRVARVCKVGQINNSCYDNSKGFHDSTWKENKCCQNDCLHIFTLTIDSTCRLEKKTSVVKMILWICRYYRVSFPWGLLLNNNKFLTGFVLLFCYQTLCMKYFLKPLHKSTQKDHATQTRNPNVKQ